MSLKSTWRAAMFCGLLAPSMAAAQPAPAVPRRRPPPAPAPLPAPSTGLSPRLGSPTPPAMPAMPTLPVTPALAWPDIDMAVRRAEEALGRFDICRLRRGCGGQAAIARR